MNKETKAHFSLDLPALEKLTPVVTSFVESSAKVYGFDKPDVLPLMLATEEVFSYLSRVGTSEKKVRLDLNIWDYYAEVEIVCRPDHFDMRAFNLTASPSISADGPAEETGLLIASRMVDRFHFREDAQRFSVIFGKERTYEEFQGEIDLRPTPLEDFSIRAPDESELKTLMALYSTFYDKPYLSKDFLYPGKMVDMTKAGVYGSLIACDQSGRIGGGITWTFQTSKTVVFYGPFIFNQTLKNEMAEELVTELIAMIAKSSAMGLLSQTPTMETPRHFFEQLGDISIKTENYEGISIPVLYKGLMEDIGATVYAHPCMREFLEEQYKRHVFAREIISEKPQGESSSQFSVIFAEFSKAKDSVTLRPIWWGEDAESTMAANVAILNKEAIANIFFHMDLGKTWQSNFAPAAIACGFKPKLILPYCGHGDIVVFQLGSSE